ncbi:MAG TPA: ABC transporter permease [Chloroflexota bacterium]|jgi:peptide/nickel transport system permease protein|nr:ABC transporter permease [Chloroflexota bacterium]
MQTFLLRRLAQMAVLMVAISALIFLLISFVPGGPFDHLMFGTGKVTTVQIERLNEMVGLDRPWYQRYFIWLGKLVQGDWGTSWGVAFGQPVMRIIGDRLGATFLLMGASTVLAVLIALPLGIYSAVRQYSVWDYLVTALSYFGLAMPTFWFGIMMMIVFSVELRWLPTSGMYTPGEEGSLLDLLRHLLMPVAVLALVEVAVVSRFMRSAMLEVLSQDFLRTARAKGLRETVVVVRHGIRNALIPVITIIGLRIPVLFAGAVVTEFIFSWPGMGQIFIQGVFASDWPIVQAILVITAFLVIASNLVADLLYAVVDPRIRYA